MDSSSSTLNIENRTFHCVCAVQNNASNIDIYRNEQLVVSINKQKLLKKSAFFQTMYKTCYKHHNSDFTDVYFPVDDEIFDKVARFINTNQITLDVDFIFEVYHLAEYLQIESLQQLCLDHFTLNLNRDTLQSQLNFIARQHYSDLKKFKERALTFKENGQPSLAGLYFLRPSRDSWWDFRLKLKSDAFDRTYVCHNPGNTKYFCSLHYSNRMICSVAWDRETKKNFLFQYDILSGKVFNFIIEKNIFNVESKGSVCTDRKYLYFFCEYINDEKTRRLHSLSVFERTNETEGFKLCREKTLSLPTLTQSRSRRHVDIYLSHCYKEKIYVFYRPRAFFIFPNHFSLDDIHLLVICKKSMSILEDQKLSAKNEKLKKGMMVQQMEKLEKLFFDEKRNKMLIKVVGPDCDNTVLVFDMKNDCFYFQENLLPPSAPSFDRLQFVSGRNGVIYAIHCYYSTRVELFKTEMIKFNLENGSLVHDGVMWETDDGAREYPKIKRITLACFV